MTYSISVPSTWEMHQKDAGDFTLTGDDISLEVLTPTFLRPLGVVIDEANPVDTLIALEQTIKNTEIVRSDIEVTLYDGRTAASYHLGSTKSVDQLDVVIELSDGTVGYLTFLTHNGAYTAQPVLISDIIGSFESHAVALTGGSDQAQSQPQPQAAVPCTVSTDSANSAQLRVGPGTNRGAISFLPVNSNVDVTGRIELDNSDVWYQLDKAQAAPNGTAAAELWVAAEQVDTHGDCDHVGETDAPPIIPGSVAPPPPQQGGSGGDNPPVQAGAVPTSGSWVLNINATTNASCQGYQNVAIPSSELFNSLTYTFTVVPINNDSFRYGTDLFTRYPGSNSFDGMLVIDRTEVVHARFDVLSPTSMRGEIVDSFNDGGVACSATILVATNHR